MKQATTAFHSMQALIKAQATVQAQKSKAFLNVELKFHSEDIHRSSLERYVENYMNNKSPFEANVRSQSVPKQRLEPAGLGKRLPLSELVIEHSRVSLSAAGMQKPQEAFSFKRAVVGRLDRSLQVSSEAERISSYRRSGEVG